MRLVFMGTPDFAVAALAALLAAGHEIAAVYCQPPRPAGRGQRLQPSPVQRFAEEKGLAVRTPLRLKEPATQAEFAALGADLAVVAAYGLMLPPPVLAAPRHGCLNIHASLLPRWRGAAPIQRAILAGDDETGITIMQMEAGLDTGPILLQEALPIGPTMTAGELHDRLAALGARLIVAALAELEAGRLAPTPQPEEGVTYAAKLDRAEGRLDWELPAADLALKVRAFDPWPGAWFTQGQETIKVLAATLVPTQATEPPGTVIAGDGGLIVACGVGALRLERLQRPGRGALAAPDFLRGYPLAPGTRLG